MATTVSERPQTRRRVTFMFTPGGVLIALFVGFILMLGLMSHIIVWHHVLIIGMMAVLGRVGHHMLRRVSKPKRQESVRPGLRPFEQPKPDLVTRMGGWSGQKVRSIPGATAELRDLITQFDWPYLRYVAGPTFVHSAVHFGGWCRDSAWPVTMQAMTRSVLGVKLWIPSAALVVTAGFTVMPKPSFNTTDLQHPGLPGGLLMWLVGAAAAFALLALVARFTIPVSSDIEKEGGRVMNDDAINANKHGAEVPTSASEFQRPDGREDTPTNITRQSILAEMPKAAGTFVGTDTVGMSTEEIAAEMAAPPQHSVLTEERPDADDPLGLGAIDAGLAGLIGADLPQEPQDGSSSGIWDDDVVSTGSRPTEGDTSVAHWAAEASQADDTGDLPRQTAEDGDEYTNIPERLLNGEIDARWTREYPIVLVPTVSMLVLTIGIWTVFMTVNSPAVLWINGLIYAALVVFVFTLNRATLGDRYNQLKSSFRQRRLYWVAYGVVLPIISGLLIMLVATLTDTSLWFLLDWGEWCVNMVFDVVLFFTASLARATWPLIIFAAVKLFFRWHEWRTNKVFANDRYIMRVMGVFQKEKPFVKREDITDLTMAEYWSFELWRIRLRLPFIRFEVETAGQEQGFRELVFVPRKFGRYI